MKLKSNLFALFLPVLATAQLSNAEFDSLYAALDQQSQEISYLGNKDGKTNLLASNFKKTSEAFSDDDLLYISLNGNPVMKANAANELVNRKSKNLTVLFTMQLLSNEKVTIHTGSISSDFGLAAALYKNIAFQKEKMERKAYYEKTSTDAQLRGVKELFGEDYDSKWTVKESDSLMQALTKIALAEDRIAPETLSEIFKDNQFKSMDYKRVKFFANKYQTTEILATLAGFKNKNDLPLLRNHVSNAYLAISLFPHPSFLPQLKDKLNKEYENPQFQQAVAAYRSAESKNVLESICKKITTTYPKGNLRDERLFALHGIIEKINCPLYSDILLRLEKTI
jgi:hypothetical protein